MIPTFFCMFPICWGSYPVAKVKLANKFQNNTIFYRYAFPEKQLSLDATIDYFGQKIGFYVKSYVYI